MAYKQKGFTPFTQKQDNPYGWDDKTFDLVKKETKQQLDSLRKEDPNAKTLEWQEFGKDQERYFTNKEKIDDIIKYMKNDLKMSDKEINK